MPFTGSTFGLWNDSALTTAFSGILNKVNFTDLSDNPQDTLLYLGSPATNRILEASSSPGVANIVLTPTDITPAWVTTTSYTLGKITKPTAGNGFVYQCITAGISGGSEPTWPIVGLGSTVVDGTCTWALYAVHHPTTEIKLSLTSGGLSSATAGAALNVATSISSLSANAVKIYIRLTNTVVTVSNNTGNAELGLFINSVIEVGL